VSFPKISENSFLRRNAWRIAVALEISLAGSIVAFVLALTLESDGSIGGASVNPSCAAILGGSGGLVGGLLLSRWYGLEGRSGWISATLASLIAPSLAGGLAGTLIFPGPGTYFGAILPLKMFSYPQSLAVWIICLVIIHMSARRLRAGPGKGMDKRFP
jgi:O-antigen ligase